MIRKYQDLWNKVNMFFPCRFTGPLTALSLYSLFEEIEKK